MQIDILLDTMQRVPTASFMLVLFMSIFGALLINHILQVGTYTTLASVPALLFSGLLAYALLVSNGIEISSDKAINTALSASFGFVTLATLTFFTLRIFYRLNDKR